MSEQSSPSVSGREKWEWQCWKSTEESDDMGRSVVYRISKMQKAEGLYSVSRKTRVPRNSITRL